MISNKSIGLDVGLSSVKAISLSRQNNEYILNAFSMVQSPPKGMISEAASDRQEMAVAIKKTIENLKISGSGVNIALPDSQVYTKVIEMPVLSDKELSLAIYWEAERYIPVSLSTITLVWSVLKRPQNPSSGEKMQVLMVAAPTSLLNKYQEVLKMAKLNLDSIETETLAIIRALSTPNSPPTVIVNIGATNTSLTIIKDGILVLTYLVQVGGDAINRSIQEDFGVSQMQSEEYKKTYGFSNDGAGQKISKATEPILGTILLEIRKALAYFSQKYKDGSAIQQVILSGETSKLPGINVYFAEKLGIETVVANPWKIFGNKQLPAEIANNSYDFTVALGLAMRNI